ALTVRDVLRRDSALRHSARGRRREPDVHGRGGSAAVARCHGGGAAGRTLRGDDEALHRHATGALERGYRLRIETGSDSYGSLSVIVCPGSTLTSNVTGGAFAGRTSILCVPAVRFMCWPMPSKSSAIPT